MAETSRQPRSEEARVTGHRRFLRWPFGILTVAGGYAAVFAVIESAHTTDPPPIAWAFYLISLLVVGGAVLTAIWLGTVHLLRPRAGRNGTGPRRRAVLRGLRPGVASLVVGSVLAAIGALVFVGLIIVGLVIDHAYTARFDWREQLPFLVTLGLPALGLLAWSFILALRAYRRQKGTTPAHTRWTRAGHPNRR